MNAITPAPGLTRTGKRRRSENRQRTTILALRVTPAEKALLEAAAKRAGKSLAALLRDTALASPEAAEARQLDLTDIYDGLPEAGEDLT